MTHSKRSRRLVSEICLIAFAMFAWTHGSAQPPPPGQYVGVGRPPSSIPPGEILVMNPLAQEFFFFYSAPGCKPSDLKVGASANIRVGCPAALAAEVRIRTQLPNGSVQERTQNLATGEAYFVAVDDARSYYLSRWTAPPSPMPPPPPSR
jgi:hypothetical protein